MCVQTRKPLTCHFNEIFKWLVKMCLLGRGLSVGAKESQAEAWIQGSDGDRRGDWIEICCEEAPASATQSEGTGTMSCPGFIVASRAFLEDVGKQWERRMFGHKKNMDIKGAQVVRWDGEVKNFQNKNQIFGCCHLVQGPFSVSLFSVCSLRDSQMLVIMIVKSLLLNSKAEIYPKPHDNTSRTE